MTVFIGDNGRGKTNILEAVSFLALARSFRTRTEKEVIRWGSEVARLVGQTDTTTIEVALSQTQKGSKLIKINGVNRKAIELLGHLAVVLFLPETLELVAGPPHLRRQFLDLLLIQEDRRYAYHLLQLQKILKQRNHLLRQIDEGIARKDQLEFWDSSLAEQAAHITLKRIEALREMNQSMVTDYQTISEQTSVMRLRYSVASVSESAGEKEQYEDLDSCPVDLEYWQKTLLSTLHRYQSREIAAGRSLYGPQRDDFTFLLNDRPLLTFGSRGEYRSAILALKSCEARYLKDHLPLEEEQIPLLFLLDDVYSELDPHRRAALTRLIGEHQAIITTTEVEHLDATMRKTATIVGL